MKHSRTDGIDPAARSRSRRRALQAVYAWIARWRKSIRLNAQCCALPPLS